ncbi:MAG: HAMP domain-containing sensor histidine kinase [Pseudomonadota bacterium]
MALHQSASGTAAASRPNPLRAFQQTLERDGLSGWSAQFKAKDVEQRYIRNLVKTTLSSERYLWYLVIVAYFGYSILDVLTVRQNLETVLTLRVISGLMIVALVPLSFIEKVKPRFGWLSACGIWFSAIGVITMIAIIPPAGAPPYIIGILVVFIASSCMMRIPFRVGAAAYLSSSVIYVSVLNLNSAFSSVDVISGHFFMLSIALVAVATNYTQEIRSRMIWLRDEQRQRDGEMIEKLLIEATAADQSKINFLSMMSHELRTPLHQIIGYTEVVTNSCKAANDTGDNVRHLNEIHGSAHVLLSRIQKMLRFVDATAGKMKYEISNTAVSELVDVALERMRAGMEKKDITVDISALEEGSVDIDIVHTCYALNNILENAIKASPEGSTIWITGANTDDNAYELSIRDEGPGMTEDQIAKALKPFTQGESALVRASEGMGLGLTIAKHIFGDQNATIRLGSDGESGACVVIRFEKPAAASEAAPEQAVG